MTSHRRCCRWQGSYLFWSWLTTVTGPWWNSNDALAIWSNCRSDEATFAEITIFARLPTPALLCTLKEDAAAPFLCCHSCLNNQPIPMEWWHCILVVHSVRLCKDLVRLAQEIHCPTLVWWYQANVQWRCSRSCLWWPFVVSTISRQ